MTPAAIPGSQKSIFSYDFKLIYKVILSQNTLTAALKVMNVGDVQFSFTALLHTYFNVKATDVKVLGVLGKGFVESGRGAIEEVLEGVVIRNEVDRLLL